MWLAALPLEWALGAEPSSIAGLLRAVAIVAPLYFMINTGLVAGAVALSTHQNVVGVWQRNFLWSAPSYLAGAALAAAATAAWQRGLFGWLLLLAAPLYLVFRSYHSVVARLREEQGETRRAMDVQLATIEALALAIEAKAGCTPEHVRSIQKYAALLAEAAGLSDADIQAVRSAALLHDIGNMAVPEHILAKPDKLTPEEFERVKIHTRVGADDPARRAVRRSGCGTGALSSRAMGRPWVSGGLVWRRHTAGRPHSGHRRCLEHAPDRAAVSCQLLYRAGCDDRAARVLREGLRSGPDRSAHRATATARRRRQGTTTSRPRNVPHCSTFRKPIARSKSSTRSLKRLARASALMRRWR